MSFSRTLFTSSGIYMDIYLEFLNSFSYISYYKLFDQLSSSRYKIYIKLYMYIKKQVCTLRFINYQKLEHYKT